MQQEQTPVGAPIMTDELEERSEGQASPDNVTDDLTWDISRLDITSLRTDQIYTHPESIEPHMEEVQTELRLSRSAHSALSMHSRGTICLLT